MRGDEIAALEKFGPRYAIRRERVNRVVERAVIGGDWGANGYATMAEADRIARILELGPGRRLLDLGAGRGWPGLYLAASTGCSVVVLDLPFPPLTQAQARARAERIGKRAFAVSGSAAALPLRSGSVHAVVATDVLC